MSKNKLSQASTVPPAGQIEVSIWDRENGLQLNFLFIPARLCLIFQSISLACYGLPVWSLLIFCSLLSTGIYISVVWLH